MGEVESGLRLVRAETESQLTALRTGPSSAVSDALATLTQATAALGEELKQVSAAHRELTSELSEHSKAALNTAQAHARALDAELERSRAATTRVHGSLAEMTDAIARHVESRV